MPIKAVILSLSKDLLRSSGSPHREPKQINRSSPPFLREGWPIGRGLVTVCIAVANFSTLDTSRLLNLYEYSSQ